MGRWANRSRRGGGPGSRPPPTIEITQAVVTDQLLGQVEVTFSAAVDADDFLASSFLDVTLGRPGETVQQVTPTVLQYFASDWEGSVQAGDDWQYTDSVPDVITPQNGTMS